MRRSRIYRGDNAHTSRKHCIACRGHIDIVGELSRRGMCKACGLLHMVAQYLGLDHVYYYDEQVNAGIRLSYTGPVIKAA
jgi:hypothetical protein